MKIGQEVIADKTTKQNNFNLVTNLKIYLLNKIENELGDKVKVVSSTKLKNINSRKEDSEEFKQLQFFVHSSPHITLLHIPKILGEEMVLRLDAKGIAVSTASACSITEGSGSNLLKSLGKDKEAKETVRISFSRANTFAEVDIFVKNLKEIIEKYQTMLN